MSTGDTRPDYRETHFTEEEERFLLRAPAEIAQILRSACNRSAMLTAYFGDGSAFTLTSLLEVDPEADYLLFDMPAQRNVVPRMIDTGPVTFTTNLDGIKIKFQVDGLTLVAEEEREGLAARLPEAVARLQRREFFRVGCPVSNPPACTIPYSTGGQSLRAEFEVADLSLGGVALMVRKQKLALEPGNVYKDCVIALPGESTFTVTIEVRNIQSIELRTGTATRVGCRFLEPRAEAITRLQRYTMRVERERNARFGKG